MYQQENKRLPHDDVFYMRQALALAKEAALLGEVPVGALVVHHTGEILGSAYNLRETRKCATAHAEVLAIESACQRLGRWRLETCTLFVTLEPCFMCAGAIVLARMARTVFGAFDPKGGAVGSLADVLSDPRLNHRCHVMSGVCAEECSSLLKSFFQMRRGKEMI